MEAGAKDSFLRKTEVPFCYSDWNLVKYFACLTSEFRTSQRHYWNSSVPQTTSLSCLSTWAKRLKMGIVAVFKYLKDCHKGRKNFLPML